MKRLVFALAGLLAAVGPALLLAQEHGGYAPGSVADQAPSQLNAFPPTSPQFPVPRSAAPLSQTTPFNPGVASGGVPGLPANASLRMAAPDPTLEFLVTPAAGPWMICVTSYSGSEAPQM